MAYRHWTVTTAGRLVSPMHSKHTWNNGENIAYCERTRRHPGTCAFKQCSCGWYAVWSQTHDYARYTRLSGNTIFGVIACYGRVALGVNGCRADKARIVALHLPIPARSTPSSLIHKRIRENYPDVRLYRERNNLVLAEGVTVPRDLIGDEFSQFG